MLATSYLSFLFHFLAASRTLTMTQPPRWLDALNASAALPANKPYPLYQLATVDAQNRPRVRTVGPQGFIAPEAHPALPIALLMTHAGSPKVDELRANSHAELVQYLGGTHEQFRLTGRARVVAAPGLDASPVPAKGQNETGDLTALELLDAQAFDWDALRAQVFGRIPDFVRAWYAGPAPGAVLGAYEDLAQYPATLPRLGGASSADTKLLSEALGNVVLIALEVAEVDWCELGKSPHRRTRFVRKGEEWEETILAP